MSGHERVVVIVKGKVIKKWSGMRAVGEGKVEVVGKVW